MKKTFALTVLALVSSSSDHADTAILVALPSELDAIRKEVRLVGQTVELSGQRVTIGYRKGEKLYIVRTGAGNLNSAMVTQAVVTRYKIDRVISIGVAGNLNERWGVGDMLCVTDVVNHQQGKETPAGFEMKEEAEVRSQKSEGYEKKCEELRQAAKEIAAGMPLLRNKVRAGRLVSGDAFIASSAKRKWLRETIKADAVDMVSAGIAHVCEANGVPYVIIRVLSDNADESASADFAAFSKSYEHPVTAHVAVSLLERLAVQPP